MSKNFKWSKGADMPKPEHSGDDLRVILFVARNKDNKDVEFFQERKRAFVAWTDGYELPDWVEAKWQKFVADSVPGETDRVYMSVNKRDEKKVKRDLAMSLVEDVMNDGASARIDVVRIESITAGVAARKENAAEKKWMFDYDDDPLYVGDFCRDIRHLTGMNPQLIPTVNGAAVIVEHGFDTRELLAKWPRVSLKRDDLVLVDWKKRARIHKHVSTIKVDRPVADYDWFDESWREG